MSRLHGRALRERWIHARHSGVLARAECVVGLVLQDDVGATLRTPRLPAHLVVFVSCQFEDRLSEFLSHDVVPILARGDVRSSGTPWRLTLLDGRLSQQIAITRHLLSFVQALLAIADLQVVQTVLVLHHSSAVRGSKKSRNFLSFDFL